jgi:hypothetical protein
MLKILVSVHSDVSLYDTQIEPQIKYIKQHQRRALDMNTATSMQNISPVKDGEFLDQPKDWLLKWNSLPRGQLYKSFSVRRFRVRGNKKAGSYNIMRCVVSDAHELCQEV